MMERPRQKFRRFIKWNVSRKSSKKDLGAETEMGGLTARFMLKETNRSLAEETSFSTLNASWLSTLSTAVLTILGT